jgi:hypothetical protein
MGHPIRPAELANTKTLTETIHDCPVDCRPRLHQPFSRKFPAPFHLLVSFLFSVHQKKRRGGGLVGGHLIQE